MQFFGSRQIVCGLCERLFSTWSFLEVYANRYVVHHRIFRRKYTSSMINDRNGWRTQTLHSSICSPERTHWFNLSIEERVYRSERIRVLSYTTQVFHSLCTRMWWSNHVGTCEIIDSCTLATESSVAMTMTSILSYSLSIHIRYTLPWTQCEHSATYRHIQFYEKSMPVTPIGP